jgi:hypothetical protein
VRQHITAHDLDLIDGRSKSPDQQWIFLKALARLWGHFGWIDGEKHTAQQKIQAAPQTGPPPRL